MIENFLQENLSPEHALMESEIKKAGSPCILKSKMVLKMPGIAQFGFFFLRYRKDSSSGNMITSQHPIIKR